MLRIGCVCLAIFLAVPSLWAEQPRLVRLSLLCCALQLWVCMLFIISTARATSSLHAPPRRSRRSANPPACLLFYSVGKVRTLGSVYTITAS